MCKIRPILHEIVEMSHEIYSMLSKLVSISSLLARKCPKLGRCVIN